MLRLVLLVLVIAGVAGYFTRPDEPKMREAADAVLSERAQDSLGDLNIADAAQSQWANMAGERAFSDYYVVTKYDVSLDSTPVVTCWGGFTKTQCSLAADTRTGG